MHRNKPNITYLLLLLLPSLARNYQTRTQVDMSVDTIRPGQNGRSSAE